MLDWSCVIKQLDFYWKIESVIIPALEDWIILLNLSQNVLFDFGYGSVKCLVIVMISSILLSQFM